ncbi:MAG: GntP family permease [Holosporaceae bacterium]|jgi:H+/gluconate symporter-like permease|nr:GntP family permease [Holosporaceae bacterium]
MLEVSSILLSVALLMFLAYRGFSVLILSPTLALFAVFLSGSGSLLAHYTQIFMVKLGDFATVYFPLFLLSAVFGKIMESSGCALSIAEYISKKIGSGKAVLAIILSCSVLTYGGISLFVVVFAVYPIAVELMRKSNTPKRLIPAAIAIGSFTYTMTCLPGSPAIPNVIPSQYFGTNTFAAPGVGIIAAILSFWFSMMWINRQIRLAKKNGEGYGDHNDNLISSVSDKKNLPSFWISIIPVFIVILLNYISVRYVFPNMDASYLQSEKYGATDIQTVAGNWAIIVAVFFAIVFVLAANYKKIDITRCINNGATESLAPIFNTASVVGYGAVINGLPGFIAVKDWILSASGGNPIISSSIVTSVLSGVTGSASGGISIALETLGAKYLEMANAIGMNPEIIHRIIAISSGSLDILPHNGAVVSLLTICGLTHRESYKDIFVGALLAATGSAVISVFIGLIFGSF